MTFNPSVTRASSGVTLDLVMTRFLLKMREAQLLADQSQVILVLDDETIPTELPQSDRFITIRIPSLIWAHGDVSTGGGNLCEFIVQGQVRITLWLRNELDIYGQASFLMDEVAGPAPRGQRLIGNIIKELWEDDVLDSSGNAILKRPMMFVSFEPPGPTPSAWKPFRIIYELEWNYDLSSGG